MLSFECDYNEGCHEKILKRLVETNLEQLPGYGSDSHCESAKKKIKAACNCPNADVWFLTGGTQTNQVVIDSMLTSYQGVIACQTGHVNVHEAGAIEYTGHKVLALPAHNGKLDSVELEKYLATFFADGSYDHMVFPGMVYISFPTEYGTLYSKKEIENIHNVCVKYEIPLFIDGARLGYGLVSKASDITLPELASLCEVFYIGGTKVGALCGEAIVFTKSNTPKHFLTLVKQHGALVAKGRILGIQFDTLFTDNLYFDISRHAIEMAELIKNGFSERGYKFFIDSPTNQQFIVLENSFMQKLSQKVRFSFWELFDETHTVVRFATSWATKKENIEKLFEIIDETK